MNSSHAQANGFMANYELHGQGVEVPTTPVSINDADSVASGGYEELAKLHRQKKNLVRRPPELGEHNAQLMKELGINITGDKA